MNDLCVMYKRLRKEMNEILESRHNTGSQKFSDLTFLQN